MLDNFDIVQGRDCFEELFLHLRWHFQFQSNSGLLAGALQFDFQSLVFDFLYFYFDRLRLDLIFVQLLRDFLLVLHSFQSFFHSQNYRQ